MTARLSRERLEALANLQSLECMALPASHAESAAMARMLLAGMDSDPVALQNFRSAMEGIGHIRRTLDETFGGLHGTHCEPDVLVECKAICDSICEAYRRTAPPAPVAVPDNRAITQHFDTVALEAAKEIMCDVNRRAHFLGGDIQLLSRIQCRIDEACRAAMLKAGPVTAATVPLDYVQGEYDGREWAAQLAEANHPQTGDWLYDDPIELAKAIRKGPDMPSMAAPDQQNSQQNIPEIIPGGLVEAVNNLLNNDGSRGCYSAIGCGEAREKIELWLAQRQKWESQRSENLCAVNSPVIPDGWIPCSERMPVDVNTVITSNGLDIGHAWWDGDRWFEDDPVAEGITHWMPLPAAPQQEVK